MDKPRHELVFNAIFGEDPKLYKTGPLNDKKVMLALCNLCNAYLLRLVTTPPEKLQKLLCMTTTDINNEYKSVITDNAISSRGDTALNREESVFVNVLINRLNKEVPLALKQNGFKNSVEKLSAGWKKAIIYVCGLTCSKDNIDIDEFEYYLEGVKTGKYDEFADLDTKALVDAADCVFTKLRELKTTTAKSYNTYKKPEQNDWADYMKEEMLADNYEPDKSQKQTTKYTKSPAQYYASEIATAQRFKPESQDDQLLPSEIENQSNASYVVDDSWEDYKQEENLHDEYYEARENN